MARKRIFRSLDRLFNKFAGLKESLPELIVVHNIVMTQTTSTDGTHIYYSKRFVDTLTDEELDGLMMHEIIHILKDHIYPGKRNLFAWNVACDFNSNSDVLSLGMKLPDGVLISDKFDGMDEKQIYRKIYPNLKKALNGIINRKLTS